MSQVVTSIEIAAPVERVWQLVMDPSRLHEWVTIHRRLHSASPYPPQRGDRMDQTLSLHAAHFRVHWTLVVCEPPRRAQWRGRGPRVHAPRRSTDSPHSTGDAPDLTTATSSRPRS